MAAEEQQERKREIAKPTFVLKVPEKAKVDSKASLEQDEASQSEPASSMSSKKGYMPPVEGSSTLKKRLEELNSKYQDKYLPVSSNEPVRQTRITEQTSSVATSGSYRQLSSPSSNYNQPIPPRPSTATPVAFEASRLRVEQDREYEEMIRQENLKEQAKRAKEERRSKLKQDFATEPSESGNNAIIISFRCMKTRQLSSTSAGGSTSSSAENSAIVIKKRRFFKSTKISTLFDYIESLELYPESEINSTLELYTVTPQSLRISRATPGSATVLEKTLEETSITANTVMWVTYDR